MLNDLGLLFLRLGFGGVMFMEHGWGKLAQFSEKVAMFPDPLGLGQTASLSLVIFAEVFCSILIMVGLTTRLAAIPLVITMCVAAFGIHVADPFAKKELALLYAMVFSGLFFTGPGPFSVDAMIHAKRQIKGAIFRP